MAKALESIQTCFTDAVLENKYMWFFDNRIQALCRMNTNNFEMEIISVYSGQEKFNARKIFRCQDKFYLTTGSAKILIYDNKIQGDTSAFSLQEPSMSGDTVMYMAYRCADCIYFLPPCINEKMIWFDLHTQKYFSKVLFESSIKEIVGNQDLRIGYSCLYKDAVWFPIYGTSFYVKYDLMEEKLNLFQAENKNTKLSGICFDGEHIWLTQNDSNNIICVGEREILISEPQFCSWLFNLDEFVAISLLHGDKLFLIHKNTFKVSSVNLPFVQSEKQQEKSISITSCCEDGNRIFLFQHGIRDLYILQKETLEIKKVRLQCENYAEKCFFGEKILLDEQEDINLMQLVSCLKSNPKAVCSQEENHEIGNSIWKRVSNARI